MRLRTASIYVAAATASKILMGLVSVKVIAWTLGTDGLGQLGQFMSVMAITSALAGGGILAGVVRYVAENKEEPESLTAWIRGASSVTLAFSVAYCLALLVFSRQISHALFGAEGFYWVIRILAFAQFLMAFANLFQGIINGHKRSDLFAFASSSGAVLAMIGIVVGSYFGGLPGAMLGLIWGAAAQFLTLFPAGMRGIGLRLRQFRPQFNGDKYRAYLSYSLMIVVSVCTIPIAQITVRNLIQETYGWSEVGQWQGMVRLSDAYLQFLNIMLASIYLPRLAEQKSSTALLGEVKRAYLVGAPFLLIVCISLYLLRDLAISILFTESFRPMRDLFSWQLTGDFFKIMSYIAGYICVAKGKTKLYIGAEVIQASIYLFAASQLIPLFGTTGATQAYAATYLIYFFIVVTVLLYTFRRDINVGKLA